LHTLVAIFHPLVGAAHSFVAMLRGRVRSLHDRAGVLCALAAILHPLGGIVHSLVVMWHALVRDVQPLAANFDAALLAGARE
jgi:hypothetical protein